MMITKAEQFLESFNDFTTEDDVIRLRANYRSGLRCPACGRMVKRVWALPAVRTCPNGSCGSKHQFFKSQHGGVGVRKV